ncbi:MAG TPA: histidine phosphatase family protein [Candidatus Baltobacteraceae bacterium]|nr:histidine phosphatase family protein [Candidatus Baltobacteraceae bacterium]
MPANIYIARHGETTWNAVGRYQGRLETPLSPLGQAQAQALAGALEPKNVERIISSPLSRCMQTAVPLSLKTGVPIEQEPLLLEIAHGTWEGRYRDEIAATEPGLYRTWKEHPEVVKFEGGESLADVLARWQKFVEQFDWRVDTLLLTHDIVVRIALLERAGRPMEELRHVHALNAAYAHFEVADGLWTLREECAAAHLAGLAADPERQAL